MMELNFKMRCLRPEFPKVRLQRRGNTPFHNDNLIYLLKRLPLYTSLFRKKRIMLIAVKDVPNIVVWLPAPYITIPDKVFLIFFRIT